MLSQCNEQAKRKIKKKKNYKKQQEVAVGAPDRTTIDRTKRKSPQRVGRGFSMFFILFADENELTKRNGKNFKSERDPKILLRVC